MACRVRGGRRHGAGDCRPAADEGGCLPRVRAAAGGDPDHRARKLFERGRGAHHRPPRGPAERDRGSPRHAVEVGRPAVVDPADLRTRHGRAACPPARRGTHRAGDRHAANVGQPAVHDAGAVLDQPHHEDRPHVRRRESDRPVDDRLLEDPRPPAAGPRCCAGRHLGRAAPTAARPRRPGEARRIRRAAPGGDGRRGGRARGRPPQVLRGCGRGNRRLHRGRWAALQHPPRPAHHGPRGTRRGTGRRAGREGPATRRYGRGRHRPRPADRRRRDQRRPGHHARRPEVSRRQHARGHPRRRGGDE